MSIRTDTDKLQQARIPPTLVIVLLLWTALALLLLVTGIGNAAANTGNLSNIIRLTRPAGVIVLGLFLIVPIVGLIHRSRAIRTVMTVVHSAAILISIFEILSGGHLSRRKYSLHSLSVRPRHSAVF
jgi:hypothetical protein